MLNGTPVLHRMHMHFISLYFVLFAQNVTHFHFTRKCSTAPHRKKHKGKRAQGEKALIYFVGVIEYGFMYDAIVCKFIILIVVQGLFAALFARIHLIAYRW